MVPVFRHFFVGAYDFHFSFPHQLTPSFCFFSSLLCHPSFGLLLLFFQQAEREKFTSRSPFPPHNEVLQRSALLGFIVQSGSGRNTPLLLECNLYYR